MSRALCWGLPWLLTAPWEAMACHTTSEENSETPVYMRAVGHHLATMSQWPDFKTRGRSPRPAGPMGRCEQQGCTHSAGKALWPPDTASGAGEGVGSTQTRPTWAWGRRDSRGWEETGSGLRCPQQGRWPSTLGSGPSPDGGTEARTASALSCGDRLT